MAVSKNAVAAAVLMSIAGVIVALEWRAHAGPDLSQQVPPAKATSIPVRDAVVTPAAAASQPASAPTGKATQSAAQALVLPPDAPPKIVSVSLSSPVVSGGQVVRGTVETSSNVASVEARLAGYSSPLTKVGVGHFVLSYTVPNLPPFLHRTYSIDVIARNTRGDVATGSIPITIR